jgi:hypothetical protein
MLLHQLYRQDDSNTRRPVYNPLHELAEHDFKAGMYVHVQYISGKKRLSNRDFCPSHGKADHATESRARHLFPKCTCPMAPVDDPVW